MAGQDTNQFSKTVHEQSTDTRLYRGCHCASSIPKSQTFFSFWNMVFELEQQEHHLPSCKLWGTKKGRKRTVKAMFPFKLACLSAHTTVACFEYASGTSRLGLSIKLRNIVERQNSPVYKLVDSSAEEMLEGFTIEQFIRRIELLEREILTLYTDGHASSEDIDQYGDTHAEMIFQVFTGWGPILSKILRDNRLTHVFVSLVRTILQAHNGDEGLFSFSTHLVNALSNPDPLQHETINTKHLLSFMSEEGCFNFTYYAVEKISKQEPSASFKRVIEEFKAILMRRFEDLVSCVARDSKSVFETASGLNVLCLSSSWPTGLRYLTTTEASTIIDDVCDDYACTPIMRVIHLDQAQSADILLQAGCCLETDTVNNWAFLSPSYRMATVMANHLAERRARLLETAQQQLGLFLEHTSVAFADSAAAEVCAALDAFGVPLHSSLRVHSCYRSIYSQSFIPFIAFKYLWEKGFQYSKGHDGTGFTPIMTHQFRWNFLIGLQSVVEMVQTVCWLVEKGFMQENARDPLGLGLNVRASGYHYLGALFARYLTRKPLNFDLLGEIPRILNGPLMSQAGEDDCVCWCNAEDHGCSPTKLFLITYLHNAPEWISSAARHLILHQELFDDSMSESHKVSSRISDTLRLLTFEALEMTHTCCYLDLLDEAEFCSLMPMHFESDDGIFYHDPASVLELRSCSEEQSSASMLDELMAAFIDELSRLTTSTRAFETFIFTYWRRRISQVYASRYVATEVLRRDHTFRKLGVSPTERTGVLPKTLEVLLGRYFIITDLDEHIMPEECSYEVVEYGEAEYDFCMYCPRPSTGSPSDDGLELDEETEGRARADDDA
ncbi:hypothetical protein NW768_002528 [Fusarium equiseti]|uniref:Uncharacterized protein n=1 Tax=Fusarium equiseti TaxID=61235 RepID=A0ABQ8RNV0_FUSEQ|nr:hypothetical protein NW768_002528 [Fusarium equiseti]